MYKVYDYVDAPHKLLRSGAVLVLDYVIEMDARFNWFRNWFLSDSRTDTHYGERECIEFVCCGYLRTTQGTSQSVVKIKNFELMTMHSASSSPAGPGTLVGYRLSPLQVDR